MTPTAAPSQIADVLATNLVAIFDAVCTERYGGPISLTRVENETLPPGTVRFRLHRPGLPQLQADFSIRHVGGSVYDVKGTVDNELSRTFAYSLPEVAPLVVPSAPVLAHNVSSFMLDALERHLGSDLLRNALSAAQELERASNRLPPAGQDPDTDW